MSTIETLLTLCITTIPFLVLGQTTEYYDNGNVKVQWEVNESTGIHTEYLYFETGELGSIVFYDSIGVLKNYYHFNEQGDTIAKSHTPQFNAQPKRDLGFIKWKYTDSGIGYCYLTKAKGKKIQTGDSVNVWYVGYFEDGGQFDNSDITGILLEVNVGEGKFLESFEEGLMLFKKGQRGFIKLPPNLAYGNKPIGNLPSNSTLIYEVLIK